MGKANVFPVVDKGAVERHNADPTAHAALRASILSPETASLFGLGTDATPNMVFEFFGKYNQHWWRRRTNIQSGKYVLSVTPSATNNNAVYCGWYTGTRNASGSVEMGNESVSINPTTGVITYGTRSVKTFTGTPNSIFSQVQSFLKNHIFSNGSRRGMPIVAKLAEYEGDDGDWYYEIYSDPKEWGSPTAAYSDTSTVGEWEYLYSSERDAYPDSGIENGIEYEYCGIPFDNLRDVPKITYGTYVGTGGYGASTPCKITLPFSPKFIAVMAVSNFNMPFMMYWVYDSDYFYNEMDPASSSSMPTAYNATSIDGNTVEWYNTYNELCQMNYSGKKYLYFAIG